MRFGSTNKLKIKLIKAKTHTSHGNTMLLTESKTWKTLIEQCILPVTQYLFYRMLTYHTVYKCESNSVSKFFLSTNFF